MNLNKEQKAKINKYLSENRPLEDQRTFFHYECFDKTWGECIDIILMHTASLEAKVRKLEEEIRSLKQLPE